MSVKRLKSARYRIPLATVFMLLGVVGAHGQAGVEINNTARQIKPGVYECVIHVEVSKEVAGTIDDVTYTLPPGHSNRKQRAQKTPYGAKVRFSSRPFITTEEAVVNVLIDFKGPGDQYITYKLVLFSRK